jgi:hypothetical protein
VSARYRLGDSEPKAPATRFDGASLHHAVEALEDMPSMFAGYSKPLVLKFHLHETRLSGQRYSDLRVGGRVLDGIVQKDQKQLMQKGFITYEADSLSKIAPDGYTPGLCARFHQCAGVFEYLVQI